MGGGRIEFGGLGWSAFRLDDGAAPLKPHAPVGVSEDETLALTFQDAGLSGTRSPLVARNRSILAHGFQRLTDAVFCQLWEHALSLANVDEASLPSFPKLAERSDGW